MPLQRNLLAGSDKLEPTLIGNSSGLIQDLEQTCLAAGRFALR
jgi:hypothetical protein